MAAQTAAWAAFVAGAPRVYFPPHLEYMESGRQVVVRMLQWCGCRFGVYSPGTVLGPNDYIAVIGSRVAKAVCQGEPSRPGRYKVVLQSEPLGRTGWPATLGPGLCDRIAMMLEYTPGHVAPWVDAGVPCVFFPCVWACPQEMGRRPVPQASGPLGCCVSVYDATAAPRRADLARRAAAAGCAPLFVGMLTPRNMAATLAKHPVGLQVRNGTFRGCAEVHRITGFACHWPALGWVVEGGLDDDLWAAVLPHAVVTPVGVDHVVAAAAALYADPTRLRALVAAGEAACVAWAADWRAGGLGMPSVLYAAMPWLQPYATGPRAGYPDVGSLPEDVRAPQAPARSGAALLRAFLVPSLRHVRVVAP
jgi:hypothetical protein